jgi:hypothetical protein
VLPGISTLDEAKKAKEKLEAKQERQQQLLAQTSATVVSVQLARKLYVVTHWESGILKEVWFTKGDTLRRFLISVGIAFNAAPVAR